jgi:hypothetical protein
LPSTYAPTEDPTERNRPGRLAEPPEASPSTGWREVCVALDVDPDATAVPTDATARAAVYDDARTDRNRRKHALGGTS